MASRVSVPRPPVAPDSVGARPDVSCPFPNADDLADGHVVLDRDLTVRAVSARGAALMEREPAALVARHGPDVCLAGTPVRDQVRAALADDQPRALDVALPGGRWCECRIRPSADAVTLVFWDITARYTRETALAAAREDERRLVAERRIQEARLSESEERFRATVEQAAVGIVHVGVDGRFLMVNERFCQLVGRDRSALALLVFPDVVFAEDHDALRAASERLLGHEIESYATEMPLRTAAGTAVPVRMTVSLMRDPGRGTPRYFIGVMEDLTGTRRAAAEVERARVEAERLAAELDTIIETMTEAVIVADRTRRILRMNPAALALHGFTSLAEAQALMGGVPFAVTAPNGDPVPPSDWPMTVALRGSTVVDLELRVTRGDTGRWWIASYAATPVRDQSGEISLVVVTGRDVTARHQGEVRERIRREASGLVSQTFDVDEILVRLARLLIDSLADWVVVDLLDAEGRSRRFPALHRDATRQPIVTRLAEFEVRPPMLSAEVLRTGKPLLVPEASGTLSVDRTYSAEQQRLFESLQPRSLAVVPILVGGRVAGAFLCARSRPQMPFTPEDLDLLEVIARRAAFAIEHARLFHEAQDANRLKDEFIATLSHELRTPLNAIIGWAQMLQRGGVPPDQRGRALATIERNAHAQAQLLGDILDVNRIITGKLVLEPDVVIVGGIVDRVVETVRPGAVTKRITLEYACEAADAATWGDAARLQQIIWNLLSNAIKFTPAHGHVRVTVRIEGAHIRVEVADTGIGIARAFLPHVFDRFRQADSSSARRHTGLGLGLAISRHLATLHGGSVSAASDGEGRGATFTLSLPLHAAGGPQFVDVPEAVPGEGALAGCRVLVVDDHADSREVITALLVHHGAEVGAAGSAEDAARQFERDPMPVALIDISMPGEDGYVCLARLTALASRLGVAFAGIACTAHAQAQDRQRTAAAGFVAHLAKPVNAEAVVRVLRSVFGDEDHARHGRPGTQSR